MRYAREFVTSTVVGGLFVVVPVYLAVLLVLKGMAVGRDPCAPVHNAAPGLGPCSRTCCLWFCCWCSFSWSESPCELDQGARFAERLEVVFVE